MKFLGEFELHVMLALARLGDGASGASIRREIVERTGREVAVGAMYATLSHLGEKGLLSFRISNPQPTRGRRARKCFSPTAAGRDSVEHSAVMLKRMMQGIILVPETRQRT